MKRRLQAGFAILAAAILLWGILAPTPTTGQLDPIAIGEKIACPKCAGESIATSQQETAREMMEMVEEQIAAGRTEQEILDFFAARFGPDVILEPPLDLGGIVLWVVPAAAVIGGVFLVARYVRREPDEEPSNESDAPERSSAKSFTGIAIAGILLVGAVFGLGQFLQPRAQGTAVSGMIVAPNEGQDLSAVSNEEMEEVLAGFADIPEANRMRLALARRYFEENDYQKAVGHFQTVLGNSPTPVEASEALGRIGWILVVNDEPEAAEAAFIQALDRLDTNSEARWFYAIMLMNEERFADAIPLLERLDTEVDVPADVAEEIDTMLSVARGEA